MNFSNLIVYALVGVGLWRSSASILLLQFGMLSKPAGFGNRWRPIVRLRLCDSDVPMSIEWDDRIDHESAAIHTQQPTSEQLRFLLNPTTESCKIRLRFAYETQLRVVALLQTKNIVFSPSLVVVLSVHIFSAQNVVRCKKVGWRKYSIYMNIERKPNSTHDAN